MSPNKRSKKSLDESRKTDSRIIDKSQEYTNVEEGGKTQSSTIDEKPEITNIEEIFRYKNPTMKHILIILREIYSSQQFVTSKYDELLSRNQELENLCITLRNENKKFKEEIQEMKQDIKKIEDASNERKLEIHGVPYKKDENLSEVIMKIGDSIESKIKEEDIEGIYRIPPNKNSKNPNNTPIVVSFIKKKDKERFLSMRRKRSIFSNEIGLTEVRSQIFVNEFLTRKTKNLLWKTKQIKSEKKFKFLWIKNGTILLRKNENSETIRITSEENLGNLC